MRRATKSIALLSAATVGLAPSGGARAEPAFARADGQPAGAGSLESTAPRRNLRQPAIETAPLAAPTPAPAAPAAAGRSCVQAPAPTSAPAPSTVPAPSAPVTVQAAPEKPKPKPKPPAPPREMALSDDPTPVLQPETFFTTAKASERYAAIVDAGGWPVVPAALSPGAKGAPVSPCCAGGWRSRATSSAPKPMERPGPRPSPPPSSASSSATACKQTGIVAGATLRAMNVPANVRFKQLASSAQRLAGMTFAFGDKYVAVNIPSTAVDAVENNHVARRYAAIVGGPDHQSPQISAKIVAINLNPTWTVPASIIKNEIIPKMRKQPNYLARARIRILNGRGEEINPGSIDWNSEKAANYTLRQDSGVGNSLGLIRIAMPNPDAVYMHDTPSRNLFANDYRFLSHGCVRVQGVYDLAAWLLQGVPVNPAPPTLPPAPPRHRPTRAAAGPAR